MKETINRMNQFSGMKLAFIPNYLTDYLTDNGFFLSMHKPELNDYRKETEK